MAYLPDRPTADRVRFVTPKGLRALLDSLAGGKISVKEAMESLKSLPFEEMGIAKIDRHRALRLGIPEVVFCEGKPPGAAEKIILRMAGDGSAVLATRVPPQIADSLKDKFKSILYNPVGRTLVVGKTVAAGRRSPGIMILTAGTSDIPVAEEAKVTAETLGHSVETAYDVGVAGVHRLFAQKARLDRAGVIIVAAGMDGVLPSLVGGLMAVPVIGVPTSCGYGANFGGIAPLLTMLNSCAPGVAVMNIDNGFGAACLAHRILSIRRRPRGGK